MSERINLTFPRLSKLIGPHCYTHSLRDTWRITTNTRAIVFTQNYNSEESWAQITGAASLPLSFVVANNVPRPECKPKRQMHSKNSYMPFVQYIHYLPTIWNAAILLTDDAARGRELQVGSEFCAQGPAFTEAPSMCRTIEWTTLASVSGILCPPPLCLFFSLGGGALGPCLGVMSHVVHISRDISQAHSCCKTFTWKPRLQTINCN